MQTNWQEVLLHSVKVVILECEVFFVFFSVIQIIKANTAKLKQKLKGNFKKRNLDLLMSKSLENAELCHHISGLQLWTFAS